MNYEQEMNELNETTGNRLSSEIDGFLASETARKLSDDVAEYTESITVSPDELEQYRAYRREYMRKYREEHPEYKLKLVKRLAQKYREQLQQTPGEVPDK